MMLKLILIALSLGTSFAKIGTDPSECLACINGICYTSNNFSSKFIGIPAFDFTGNILYFSRGSISKYTSFSEDGNYQDFKEVPGIPYYARGHTVDQKTRKVYVWMEHNDEYNKFPFTKNCSYVYDPITANSTELAATEEAIKEMYFKEKLYYTLKFRNGLFKYENNPSIPAFDGYNVSQFVIDRLEDIYFSTANGTYMLKKGTELVTFVSSKNYFVSVDKDENIYFFDPVEKTIQKLDYETNRIVDDGAINSAATDGILFDKFNNLLFRSSSLFEWEWDRSWDGIIKNGRCRIDVDRDGKRVFVNVDDTGSVWQRLLGSLKRHHPNAISNDE